jgi:hypothetical protein
MKKTMMALSVLAALITLASGCDQLERGSPAVPETGVLRVVLDGGGQRSLNILRTVLPKYDAASLYYTLTFTATGGPAYTDGLGPVNGTIAVGESSGDFTLAAGIWSLDVKGFASEAASADAANALVSGSEAGIEISGSAGASISVAMTPDESKLTSDAAGTLSYDISFPGGVTRASLAVHDDNGDIVGSPVDLLTANKGSRTIPSGVYDLAISLYMGEKLLARGATVHIRDGLSTSVVWSFVEQDFAEYTTDAISGFTLNNVSAVYAVDINQESRAITVIVPSSQSLSGLSAEISYTGIVVEPDPATGRDYSSPVTYTVTLEDGTEISYTVRVITNEVSTVADLNSLLDVAAANTADNPLPVKLSAGVNLADSGGNGLADFLSAIAVKGKYVDLDISDCGMSGTEFNPGATGNLYITGLVLPDVAKSIAEGLYGASTFNSFTGLRTLISTGLETVSQYAFSYCTSLVSVSLPNVTEIGDCAFQDCEGIETFDLSNVTEIGDGAFQGCEGIETFYLPNVTSIGMSAFGGCTSLASVSLPAATSIGIEAFGECTKLVSASLPVAAGIGVYTFYRCASLEMVNLPAAANIGDSAFYDCASLVSVSLPAATSIGEMAFDGCAGLVSVSLPAAKSIGQHTFNATGNQSLTLTLGAAAPVVGVGLFSSINQAKDVTINVPSGASGYGGIPFDNADAATQNWGNAFRGMGWDGTSYESGAVNANVTLTVQYTTP